MTKLAKNIRLWEVIVAHYQAGLCGGKSTYVVVADNGEEAVRFTKALIRERFSGIEDASMVCNGIVPMLSGEFIYTPTSDYQ